MLTQQDTNKKDTNTKCPPNISHSPNILTPPKYKPLKKCLYSGFYGTF